MGRDIRYQGAIIRDDHILLIKHREHASGRSYWVIPGGGREVDETEEACVKREMLEETNLKVTIERLLLDEAGIPQGVYRRLKTYLCRAETGNASPGVEPEVEASQQYAISEVRWFDLRDPAGWDAQLKTDPFTYPLLQRIQTILGYPVAR
jgi:ADP-ribose pyrophosphatase YjhB (NUDIX family)